MADKKTRHAKTEGEPNVVKTEEFNKRDTYPELRETEKSGKKKGKTLKYTWVDRKGKRHKEEVRIRKAEEKKGPFERSMSLYVKKESVIKSQIEVIVSDWKGQPNLVKRVLQALGEDELVVDLSEGSPMPLSEFGLSPAEFGKRLGIPIDVNFRGKTNIESIEHVVNELLSFGAWESTIIGKRVKIFLYSEIDGFLIEGTTGGVGYMVKVFDTIKVAVMGRQC